MSYLDATGEPLAGLLGPGNAGSGTAEDYINVLEASLAQLPVDPEQREVVARSDSAGGLARLLEGLPAGPRAFLRRPPAHRHDGPALQ